MRSQARRHGAIDPMHVLGWTLFIVGAVIVAAAVVAAIMFALSLLFSMGSYIQSAP